MPRFLLLGLVLAACSSGPTIPDGGTACSINADCPGLLTCNCPVVYQNCVNGICSTTCPLTNQPAGQPCGADCECESDACGADNGMCCPLNGAASGASCQTDCDCVSIHCSSNVCM